MSKIFKSFLEAKYQAIKYKNYFNVYDQLFSSYINKKIIFVEIGVFQGGSLQMWRKFFGNKARIIGIDINPGAKKFEKDGTGWFRGGENITYTQNQISRYDYLPPKTLQGKTPNYY